MSPTVPILFALLLSLVSGSAENGQRMDPVALLRQTLRYWRKIYKTYHEEVMLGYCWADYFLQISEELLNLSTPQSATGDRFNATAGAMKNQQKPFPANVMADETRLVETRGKRLREKRSQTTARPVILQSIKGSNRHETTAKLEIIKKQESRAASKVVTSSNETDEKKKIIPLNESYIEKRRYEFSIVREFFYEGRGLPWSHEFSSGKKGSRTINPTPNLKEDDKVGSGSRNLEEDMPRKVLRFVTDHRGSFVENDLGPRSFSLKVSRRMQRKSFDVYRFPFRRYPSRENGSRICGSLAVPVLKDRGMKRVPEERRIPLNNDGNSWTPWSLQFRRLNVGPDRRVDVVKLMDSVENSSCDPARAINPKTPRRMFEELSRDSLLSPGRIVAVERLPRETRKTVRAVKQNPSRSETRGSDLGERRYRESSEGKVSRSGRNILTTANTACQKERNDFFLPSVHRMHRQISHEKEKSFDVSPTVANKLKQENDTTQIARSVFLPHRGIRSFIFHIRSIVIAAFRTLGMFVQVGRQIIDIVESNTALTCAKEYLWIKLIRWIDA